jgi:hypothetical protein
MWPVTDVILAYDVGGTKLLGGLVTADGVVALRRQVPTPRDATGCDPGLAAFAGLAADLVADAGREGLNVVAAGVGFAEYVHDDRPTSSEVFVWDRQPADLLAEVLPERPVAVEADVRCAVAEAVARTPASTAAIATGFTMQKYRSPVVELYGADGVPQMQGDDWAPEGFEQWSDARASWEVSGETDPNCPSSEGRVVEIDSGFPALDYSSIEPAGADHRRAHDPRS